MRLRTQWRGARRGGTRRTVAPKRMAHWKRSREDEGAMGNSIPKTMRAIVVRKAGGPEVLSLEQRPVPAVRPGWSLVRIRARGLNHSEVFTRQGLSPSVRFPHILGIECVGEVVATTDPARLPVGQKAVSIMGEMGRAFDGSYADFALLPNEQIHPIESDLSLGSPRSDSRDLLHSLWLPSQPASGGRADCPRARSDQWRRHGIREAGPIHGGRAAPCGHHPQ